METNEKLNVINSSGISILSCVLSLQFITNDLAEMETTASRETDGYYSGVTNIIELLAVRILEEVKTIIKLSE